MGSKTSFQQAQRQTASGKRLKRMFIFHTVRKSFILNGSSLHQFEHRVSTCVICVCDLWDIPVHINHINCTRLATWGYTKSVAQVKYACQILLNRTYSCPHYLKRHMIWISMPNIRNHDVASSCDRNKMYWSAHRVAFQGIGTPDRIVTKQKKSKDVAQAPHHVASCGANLSLCLQLAREY